MKIFISYRRVEDKASNIVYILHAKLSRAFGENNIFRDTREISAGTEWRARLDHELLSCKVMLVVIGPDWATMTGSDGKPRILDEKDVTRWEVETGLRRRKEENIAFIPVLVQGAKLPGEKDLPPTLHELSEIQTITLRNDLDLDVDLEKMIRAIRTLRAFREDDINIKDFEPKTIFIDEGIFWMGNPEREGIPKFETPQHEVSLPSFRIGKYPVTNGQFRVYTDQRKIPVPRQMGWDGQKVRAGKEDHPVVGVTWKEALSYCRWLSEQTGREYTLPNEAQWEKACRGGSKTFYPWGEELDPQRCNYGRPELSAVKAYPEQNDYGCHDFVGNVRQWTCTLWGEDESLPDPRFLYPWCGQDGRNNLDESKLVYRVVRGSSFKDESRFLRCSARSGESPESRGYPGWRIGFRVALIEK